MSRLRVLFLAMFSLVLVACNVSSPGPPATPPAVQSEPFPTPTPTAVLLPHGDEQTPTPPAVQAEPSPTPTPTVALLPHSDEQTPTTPEPSGGEVEIRIPFDIYSEGELPPADVPECVNTIPFRIIKDGSRTMIEGEGRIECDFVDTPQGVPITFHVILEFDGVLNGELLPATPNRPSGWLDAYLTLDGAIAQYYTGYPPQATNPCPESNPCRMPNSDVIPLPFAYEEGSTVTTPWTFILHLG